MSTERSRTAQLLPDAPARGAAMGTWGAWVGVLALTLFLAGMAAAALYLHTGQGAWPPVGITRPGRTRALVAALVAVAAGIVLLRARRSLHRGERRPAALRMLVTVLALVGSIAILGNDLASSGFRWDEHAYTSLYWVLTGTAMTALALGVLMVGAVLVQTLTGVVDSVRNLELDVASILTGYAVFTTLVCLALVHLLPSPGGGP